MCSICKVFWLELSAKIYLVLYCKVYCVLAGSVYIETHLRVRSSIDRIKYVPQVNSHQPVIETMTIDVPACL